MDRVQKTDFADYNASSSEPFRLHLIRGAYLHSPVRIHGVVLNHRDIHLLYLGPCIFFSSTFINTLQSVFSPLNDGLSFTVIKHFRISSWLLFRFCLSIFKVLKVSLWYSAKRRSNKWDNVLIIFCACLQQLTTRGRGRQWNVLFSLPIFFSRPNRRVLSANFGFQFVYSVETAYQ
jgi:hypothetical protein